MNLGSRTLFIIMSFLFGVSAVFLLFTVMFKINPVTEYNNSSFGQIETIGYEFFNPMQRITTDPINIVIVLAVQTFSIFKLHVLHKTIPDSLDSR